MEWWITLLLVFLALMLLFLMGVPVAFSFLFINIIGVNQGIRKTAFRYYFIGRIA